MKSCVAALCLLFLAPLLRAQTPPPAAPPPKAVRTLADALDWTVWDAARRGVLLAVAPASVKPPPVPRKFDDEGNYIYEPVPASSFDGYALADVLPIFRRQQKKFGAVTAVAPVEMVVLNPNPGPPDWTANLGRRELTERLMASLTGAQWRQIGTSAGLGAGAMTGEQRALWERILPDPMVVDRTKTRYAYRERNPAKTIALTAQQRADVRLKIEVETSVDAKRTKDSGYFPVVFDQNRSGGDKEFLALAGDEQYAGTPDKYGQMLSQKVPNVLKRGQLDVATLTAAVSLTGTPTVGELVKRIGRAGRIELYADARIAKLSVWTRGESAPGGDILRALCLCVCGAVRQVGPAYVLTSDVAGIAPRRAIVDDWIIDATRAARQEDIRRREKMAVSDRMAQLSFADGDPLALPSDVRRDVEAYQRQGKPGAYAPRALDVPLSRLPPAQQTFIQNAADKLAKVGGGRFAVDVSQVKLSLDTWLTLVIPGLGDVRDGPLVALTDLTPRPKPEKPANAPGPTPPVTLLVRVETQAYALRAVRAAVKNHLAALWLETKDETIVKAAVAAAKKSKLPVGAVVRLLRPLGKSDPRPPDINALGETAAQYAKRRGIAGGGDYLAPDAPGVRETLTETLASLSRIPGLAAIILRDAAPPGWRDWPDRPGGNPEPRADGAGAETGWNLAARLAFLRETGTDPLDIVPYELGGASAGIPFFPDAANGNELASAWDKWRGARAAALLEHLTRVVRPSMPLYLRVELSRVSSETSLADLPAADAWYARQLPGRPLSAVYRRFAATPLIPSVRGPSPSLLLSVADPRAIPAALTRAGPGWNGLVLDGSDAPLEKALTLLESAPRW